jgi:F-type H+-transporting ATPase subunit delta
MPEFDPQSAAIGHVFAQSLFNLARQQNVLDDVTESVRGVGQLVAANPSFRNFAEAASITPEQKVDVVAKAFDGKVNQLVAEVLKSMARRDRLMFIAGFVAAYESILQRLNKQVDVELVTAQELSPESFEKIKAAVTKALGKTPEFETRVDASLIGGIRLRVGDTLVDASVRTQLEKIKTRLQDQGIATLQKRLNEIFVN